MLTTYLKEDGARKLRRGIPCLAREDILRVEGSGRMGEPSELRFADGERLGVADLDLDSPVPLRRLGLPNDRADGVVQRHLRRALDRRANLVVDPRFCRIVNDDGDGLPGLVIDRYDQHFVMHTFSRAMDSRVEEIARLLVEIFAAQSVLLRNDHPRRALGGLALQRPHVLYGAPPRWSRVLELGARFTVDLYQGLGSGYFYDQRQVRRIIRRLAAGCRILDPCCYVGGLFVHAGLGGAKEILAFEIDPDFAELARENAEANGISPKVRVQRADAFEALRSIRGGFDLVVLDSPDFAPSGQDPEEAFVRLTRLAVRATRRGGRLVMSGYSPPLPPGGLDAQIALACAAEGRVAFRLSRPALPPDFPTVLGAPGAETMSAVALELS